MFLSSPPPAYLPPRLARACRKPSQTWLQAEAMGRARTVTPATRRRQAALQQAGLLLWQGPLGGSTGWLRAIAGGPAAGCSLVGALQHTRGLLVSEGCPVQATTVVTARKGSRAVPKRSGKLGFSYQGRMCGVGGPRWARAQRARRWGGWWSGAFKPTLFGDKTEWHSGSIHIGIGGWQGDERGNDVRLRTTGHRRHRPRRCAQHGSACWVGSKCRYSQTGLSNGEALGLPGPLQTCARHAGTQLKGGPGPRPAADLQLCDPRVKVRGARAPAAREGVLGRRAGVRRAPLRRSAVHASVSRRIDAIGRPAQPRSAASRDSAAAPLPRRPLPPVSAHLERSSAKG